MRECTRCHQIKADDAFKRRVDRPNLLRSWCRACDAAAEREKREALTPEQRRATCAINNAKAAEKRHAWQRDWAAKHRERRAAYAVVRRALKNGNLVRPDACAWCARNDAPRLCAHHHDYSKPLDVQFICDRCHRRHHHSDAA